MSEELTREERDQIEEMRRKAVCACGHRMTVHNRFMADARFAGCFECDCSGFEWADRDLGHIDP